MMAVRGNCDFENTEDELEFEIEKLQKENAELKNKLKEKDKIIDLMAVHLIGATMFDNDEPIIFLKEEKVKQYFERQVKNDTKCT